MVMTSGWTDVRYAIGRSVRLLLMVVPSSSAMIVWRMQRRHRRRLCQECSLLFSTLHYWAEKAAQLLDTRS